MIEIMHRLRDRGAHPRRLAQILEARAAHRARGAEVHQQRLLARGADARHLVERRAAHRLRALLPVDRKSTRLNSSPLMRISYAVFCLKKKKIQNAVMI